MTSLWNRFDRAFAAFRAEFDRFFSSEMMSHTAGGVTVDNCDGHIRVSGPTKSLTVNGRLVRFKED